MRLKNVQTKVNTNVPGAVDDTKTYFSEPHFTIEYDAEVAMVTVRKDSAVRIIPLSNVASMEPATSADAKKGRAA